MIYYSNNLCLSSSPSLLACMFESLNTLKYSEKAGMSQLMLAARIEQAKVVTLL